MNSQCNRRLTWSPKNADSTNQKQLPAYARAERDVFYARLQWQGMVNLYKRGIFVITQTKFATQTEVTYSVSVHILANNALRAHHASAHGGLSANGLSDICLSFFEMILSSCLKLRLTVDHSIL